MDFMEKYRAERDRLRAEIERNTAETHITISVSTLLSLIGATPQGIEAPSFVPVPVRNQQSEES